MTKAIKTNYILTILFTLFLFVGCVKKIPTDPDSTLNLPIGLAESLSGVEIKTYRILVYNNGNLISNTSVTNTQDDIPTTKIKVAKGVNNFYVFCNETAEMKTKIDNVASESDLENITFTSATTVTNSEIPMYGKVLNALIEVYNGGVNVTVNGITKTHLTMTADRLMVRLSLTFIKNIIDANKDFVVDGLKINIHRMPKTTTIKPNTPYTTTDWVSSASIMGSGTITNNGEYIISNGNYSIADGVDNIKLRNLYIPEHVLVDATNKDKASYIVVEVTYHMKNGSGAKFTTEYNIDLGQAPPTNYNLNRNNHIDIYATIRKLGDGLVAAFNIVPWNDGGSIDVEEPEGMYFLNLSAAYVKYPHVVYIDKLKNLFIKDINGNLITPPDYNYSCLFWTNKASSKVSVTDFIMDEDPSKSVDITQSMSITEDNTIGDTHSVKGRIDIKIPTQDILAGFEKNYSMRLKSDILNRKLVFTILEYDIIEDVIHPGFDNIPDLVITGHGTSRASSTEESFDISICVPKGNITFEFYTNPTSSNDAFSVKFSDITPYETDKLTPRTYRITYTSRNPRNVTLKEYKAVLRIIKNGQIIYTSPFDLTFNVKK